MEWFKKFMEDRTGVDHLSLALLIVSILLFLVGKLFGWAFFAWLEKWVKS